uniref:NAD(P)(+) transhydrogenase (Si-specific) n=1 Tax=Hyaloperonospora arabidopsidis (strain Emoy2) TaxID=559515 RepID=M4C3E6_HYAAE
MTRLWTATTSAWLRRRGARLTSTQSQLSPVSSYDLVVIGSGPSATQCALDSAKQGKRVAIVDKKTRLGGVCVHTGTIPSKTFREAVLHLSGYRHHGFYGKSYSMKTVTIEDILYRVQRVVSSEEDVVRAQLKAARVDVIPGFARFESAHEISIVKEGAAKDKAETGQCSNNMDARTRVRADKFLVACGTRPAHNPLVPIDGKIVIDSDQILKRGMQQLPRSLIVVGAGVIGMEYASMINVVPGHSVTVVDARPDVSCSDCIGAPALASTSMEQGRLASCHMWEVDEEHAGTSQLENGNYPYGIYTIPEISMVGQTEQQLTKDCVNYEIGIAKYSELAKGQMMGAMAGGTLKILFDPDTLKVLGVHAIGEGATEIIHIGQVAMAMGCSLTYFRDAVFNYPTLAEAYRVAALNGLGRRSRDIEEP